MNIFIHTTWPALFFFQSKNIILKEAKIKVKYFHIY